MDAQVGFLLDELEKSGQADNTIIVFVSDHGYLDGEHGIWGKNEPFEETAHVPLIIVVPHMKQPGVASKSIVELIDILSTLTDLCGLSRPQTFQVVAFVRFWKILLCRSKMRQSPCSLTAGGFAAPFVHMTGVTLSGEPPSGCAIRPSLGSRRAS